MQCPRITGLQPLGHKTSLPQARCRHQLKKSIIRSRAGSTTPRDLCQKSSLWLRTNERGRLWLCAGAGGRPQAPQKGKCAAATRLLMMQRSLERPSKPGQLLGTQTLPLPSRSSPRPALQPIPLPRAFAFPSPALSHLCLPFPVSIPLPSPQVHCKSN